MMNCKGDLALKRVTKKYADNVVVRDVSIEVASGEFFSLLGPSGSGKTTTLMMIAGFASVDGGQLLLGGEDISKMTPQQRNLGMVFQSYALFPHMSVFDNVAFPLKVRKIDKSEIKRRVLWALEVVKLTDLSRRLPKQLSGGQQQRVALARAIVFHPKVILMDEPLGALDKNLRYHMQVELKEIQRELGMTVIYVTHDQEEAMNMSDRLAIMNDGVIVQQGTPREVYQEPTNEFAATFLGEANLIKGESLCSEGILSVYSSEISVSGAKQIFVRPERIKLASDGNLTNERPWVKGVVKRVSFLGNVVRYGVDIGSEKLLTVDVSNNSCQAEKGHELGSNVIASWEANDARILSVA